MRGYVQMIPVPASLDKDEEVLDRMVAAVDGATDQVERRKAFFDKEKAAFLEWSGMAEADFYISFLRGYPTLFLCFYGPFSKKEQKTPMEERIEGFVSSLASDVVYGDIGCKLNGVSFATRARWMVDEKKSNLPRVSVTQSDGQVDALDNYCSPSQEPSPAPTTGRLVGSMVLLGLIALIFAVLVVVISS